MQVINKDLNNIFQSLITLRLLIINYLSQIRIFLNPLNFFLRKRFQITKHLINIDPIRRKLCFWIGYLFVGSEELLLYIHFSFFNLDLEIWQLLRAQCAKLIELHCLPVFDIFMVFCLWCWRKWWGRRLWYFFAKVDGVIGFCDFGRSHCNDSFTKVEQILGKQTSKYLHAVLISHN